jgi:hypothetical protein
MSHSRNHSRILRSGWTPRRRGTTWVVAQTTRACIRLLHLSFHLTAAHLLLGSNMGKKHDLPAMPWYWGDWFKATDIQSLDRATKCTWFEMLGRMWESTERGVLSINGRPMSDNQLANLIGYESDVKTGMEVVNLLLTTGICSRRTDGAIYNRRMVREEEIRSRNATNGAKGGNPALIQGRFVSGTVIPKHNRCSEDEDEDSIKRINTGEEIQSNTEESSTRVDLGTQTIPIMFQQGESDWRLSISTFEQFDAIRKAYPGTRRGNRTELDCFLQHHDAAKVIDKLMPAIEAQKAHRKRLVAAGDFCPNWPHFGTWLKGRQWELEFETNRPQPAKDTPVLPPAPPPEDRPSSVAEIADLLKAGLQTHVPKNPLPATSSPATMQLTDEIFELLSPYLPPFRITNLRKMVKNLTPDLVRSKLELMEEEPRTDPGSFLFQAIVFNYQSKKQVPLDTEHATAVNLNYETTDSSTQPTVTPQLKA